MKKIFIYTLMLCCMSAMQLRAQQVLATITQIQNGQDGSISLYIQGGNPPFTFQWTKESFL